MKSPLRILVAAVTVASTAVLAGCVTSQPGMKTDPYTGRTVYYSRTVDAKSGLFLTLKAQAVYSPSLGYGVRTNYFSVASGWLFLEQAYAGGVQYPYTVNDRQTMMCDASTGCAVQETGFVEMSKEQFKQAASAGFDFKLVGRRGSVIGKINPDVFKQVLMQLN